MPTMQGIDVSNWQGTIDWLKVKEAGVEFAFIKVTEGIATSDQFFAFNWQQARQHGLARGAYHFAQDNDPIREAAWCMQVVEPYLLPGDVLVLDNEVQHSDIWWALDWLETVKRELHFNPMYYASLNYIESNPQQHELLKEYGLWLAAWGQEQPATPKPWAFTAAWQRSNAGFIPGVSGSVDLDVFFGDVAQFHKYGKP